MVTEGESSTPSVDFSSLDMESFLDIDQDISFNLDQNSQISLEPGFSVTASCQQIVSDYAGQTSQLPSVDSNIQDMSAFDQQLRESYTTLMLTDVQPTTLSEVMNILMRDRVKVSMSLNGTC